MCGELSLKVQESEFMHRFAVSKTQDWESMCFLDLFSLPIQRERKTPSTLVVISILERQYSIQLHRLMGRFEYINPHSACYILSSTVYYLEN